MPATAVVGLAIALAGAPAAAGAQAEPDRVEAQVGGRRAELAVARHRTYAAVNAAELAGAVLDEGSVTGQFLRARIGTRILTLEAGSPFFRFGDRTYQLANPPYRWGGSFWVPAELVTRWMPRVLGAGSVAVDEDAAADQIPRRADPGTTWNVIIDPGHGGRDPGTLGQRSQEKDIVLAIGRALRDELRGESMIEPFMTRDSDVYVKHDDRSAFAVGRRGDLFVSIHANSASARSARGFETIFLGEARSEEARDVALRENRTPDLDEAPAAADELMFILTGLDRTENLAESSRFAGFVQNAMRSARGRGVPDRGVKQGPWWVLLGALARMPSVIVEVGFVSNPDEEGYLSSTDGQRQVARAIAAAIVDYRRDVIERFGQAGRDAGPDAGGEGGREP